MTMKKRIAALLLAVLLIAAAYPINAAAVYSRDTTFETAMAYDLKALGLFQGVGTNADGSTNFDLTRAPSRAEALTMLVRILGKEAAAKSGTWSHPFTDVPAWASPYIGYAYQNGLTYGVSATEFGADMPAASYMYMTFVLRALGYSDPTDFAWDKPFGLAAEAGLLPAGVDTDAFCRADVVLISYAALFSDMKAGTKTLSEHLIAEGALSQAQFDTYADARLLLSHTVPELRLTGNWPCSEALLQQKWAELYPLYARYLGLPTKILTEGITWEWDDTITPDTVGYYAEANSFKMGPLPQHDNLNDNNNYNYEPLILQCMHETAHLFWQEGTSNLDFSFGQWAWEAAALIAEKLLFADYYGTWPGALSFDLVNLCGWDAINGVMSDGNKYARTIVDGSATEAFFLLCTVLSDSGSSSYFQAVNDLRLEHYQQTGALSASFEDYLRMLDEAAGSRTIDGLKPSEWMASRAVANTDGRTGDYLIVYPMRPIDDQANRYDVLLAGWNRYVDAHGDKAEVGLAGQKVDLSLYDSSGKPVSTATVTLGNDGCGNASFTFPAGALKRDSVVRYTATATMNGQVLTAANYGIFAGPDYTANDDRMFIILTDENGSVLTTLGTKDLAVTGAASCDTSHLSDGYLVVRAAQGHTVTITAAGAQYHISKPLGPRIVPIIL
jgi:hypothetical protein